MAKLKKEYNPNRPVKRLRRPIIYIICEGRETETLYFRNFRTRNCLVDIVPLRTKNTAADPLVKRAKALVSQTEYSPKDGDEIWCVFDRDTNTNPQIAGAVQYANQKGYKVAYSNPSFEYWYLLHFEKHYGYLNDSGTVIKILKNKGYLKDYDKNIDYYAELLARQPEAIQRAKERLEQLYKDNIIILSCDSNPVTTVHELVEYLNSKRQ